MTFVAILANLAYNTVKAGMPNYKTGVTWELDLS